MKAANNLQRELISNASRGSEQEELRGRRLQGLVTSILAMRRKAATVVLIALSVSLGLYAIFGRDGLVAYQQKQHQAERLHQQIVDMQKQNDRMALHDQRLLNDRDTIAYEARQRMHYTRPGEVIYTLPEAPKDAGRK